MRLLAVPQKEGKKGKRSTWQNILQKPKILVQRNGHLPAFIDPVTRSLCYKLVSTSQVAYNV
jgi:hypothetical protein